MLPAAREWAKDGRRRKPREFLCIFQRGHYRLGAAHFLRRLGGPPSSMETSSKRDGNSYVK
jgi:hypothetical protein